MWSLYILTYKFIKHFYENKTVLPHIIQVVHWSDRLVDKHLVYQSSKPGLQAKITFNYHLRLMVMAISQIIPIQEG